MTLEILLIFTRLGCITFGGPSAHIAIFEEEFVRRRGWISAEEFLALNAAAQVIPGPNSTELAIHIGYKRGGWPGLLAAGLGFILPAALLTLVVAWAYVRYGALPEVRSALLGIQAAVIAVILRATVDLGRKGITDRWLALIALGSAIGFAIGLHELILLFGGALLAALPFLRPRSMATALFPVVLAEPVVASPLVALFVSFAKISALLFGSGYVLYAFLQAEFVDRAGLLTTGQVADAIAAGQLTPGPLFSTATFVGYIVAGGAGAAVATLGIFLPAFIFVALSAPLLPFLDRHPGIRRARDGVVAASLGLLAATLLGMARGVVSTPLIFGVVTLPATFLSFRTRLDPALLILGGAVIGTLLG